tara:strand:- start:181 stop:1650 length:1470 start_codon:yes stop_codon:yes gene_type:complete
MALTKISTSGVKDDAITNAKLANDSVGADQIANNSITASELADDAVDTNAIQDNAVTRGKLASGVTDLSHDTSPQLGGDLDCNQKGILLQDRNSGNQGAVKWGDNGEMWMFHAGSDNTNRIYSSGKEYGIWSGASNDHVTFKVTASDDAPGIELYYDNDRKLHTRNTGITVEGGARILTDSPITGTPFNYLYGYAGTDSKNGITIEGNEAGLELLGTASGDHAASVVLRNLNDGFAIINNNDHNRLEIKHFTASSDNFNAHGTGNGVSLLKRSANFNESGAVELFHDNSKKLETHSNGSKTTGYHQQTSPIGFTAYRSDSTAGNVYPLKNSSGSAINATYIGHTDITGAQGQLTNSTTYNSNGAGGSCFSNTGSMFTAPVAGVYVFHFNLSLYVVDGGTGSDNSVGWGFYKNQSAFNFSNYTSGLAVTQSTPYVIGQDTSTNLTNAFEIGAPSMTSIISLAAGDDIQVGWYNMGTALGVRSFVFTGYLL